MYGNPTVLNLDSSELVVFTATVRQSEDMRMIHSDYEIKYTWK
jgi:hypothetical protein